MAVGLAASKSLTNSLASPLAANGEYLHSVEK